MDARLHCAARLGGSILLLATAAWLAGCGGGSGAALTEPPPAPWALRATNDAGLTAYFREALGPSGRHFMDAVATGGAPPPAPGTSVFSGTTLQEPGVDEADLVKSDGAVVFDLAPADGAGALRRVLRRQRLDGAAPAAALGPSDRLALPFSADVGGTGIYLDSERRQIAALGQGGMARDVYANWFAPLPWTGGATEVVLVDTAAPSQLQARRTLRIGASLIGSRRIGGTLYLVVRSTPQPAGFDPWWPAARTASNQAVLDALQPQQLLPTISVDGGAPQPLVQASACFLQDGNAVRSADVITIVGIDLGAPTERHSAVCFAGGTEAFYLSERNLYLATTRSAYSAGGGMPVYGGQSSTDIHKFALDGLAVSYRGSGNVTGHLGFDQNRKSFRMGEHADALRVVTQTQASWGGIGLPVPMPGPSGSTPSTATTTSPTATIATPESPGRLSILAERAGALKVVGELPNAARPEPLGKPGELLYASRFIGPRGYVVTYRLTDPLYVLDLSDPADPKVAGQLQVEGYSDYLFPLGERLLLGVGKDAVSDGSAGDGRFAWYQGVKVSLIDVSDPAHPREAARSIIGRRGTSATVLYDHHGIALQTLGTTVRVSLPVSLHDTPPPNPTGSPMDYYLFTRTELQRFEIDMAAQRLVPRAPLAGGSSSERDIADDRSLLWNDQVHWYQGGPWRSAPW